MLLTSSERSRYFDEYVASVDAALRHPQVAAQLGNLTSRLLQINAEAFLPNAQGNQLQVPKKFQGSPDAPAIVPVSIKEAENSAYLIEPILSDWGPLRKLSEQPTSSISGVTVKADAMLWWLENESDEYDPSYASSTGLKAAAAARTIVGFATYDDEAGGEYYAASRPVIVAKAELLAGLDAWNQTATVGHEEVHALDIVDNPILYKMPIGGAGSELAAYHLSDVLYDMTAQPAAPRAFAREVEEWRRQNLSISAPFAANDEQLSVLRGWVIE